MEPGLEELDSEELDRRAREIREELEREEAREEAEARPAGDLRSRLGQRPERGRKASPGPRERRPSSDKENSEQPEEGPVLALHGYSRADIDNTLIPFKKRQFEDLQLEETRLKAAIERQRSAASTPVRRTSEQEEPGRRVSPIKVSLRDLVIEPPSSSSSEPSGPAAQDPVVSTVAASDDDNANFPHGLDLSGDLDLTDSEAEGSPRKRPRLAAASGAPPDPSSAQAISCLLR
jgi:hypothetical protein